MMGGNQSFQKGNIDDVFNYFEEELDRWTTISNNLKEHWEKNDRSWVPLYLFNQMEETEGRWKKIKSMILPPRKEVSHVVEDPLSVKVPSNYQEIILEKDQSIKRMKEENETLLQKNQRMEKELEDLRQSRGKRDQQSPPISSKLRLSEYTQRPESGARKTGTQQNEKQQGNIGNAHGYDTDANKHSTNEEQKKQRIEFEERKNLMKQNKELQDEINRLQADKQKLKLTQNQQCRECMARSVPVKHEKQSVKNSYEEKLQTKCLETIELREEIDILKAQNDSLKTYTKKLTEEKDELLLRLSKFAGDKLVANNPAVTDLSDPNRPTKLAEFYSELYDNEWTNAFEALQSAGYDERTTIETLRLTLENVLQFCEGKADLLLRKASDAVNLLFKEYQQSVLQMKVPSHLTLPRQNVNAKGIYLQRENSSLDEIKLQRMWKPRSSEKEDTKSSSGIVQAQDTIRVEAENKLKNLRKEMASTMVPIVQKAYIEASWTDGCIDEMKPYILKCLYLGWMMKVQSPPMVFHKCKIDVGFDRNLYKEYVTSGPRVNYVVWPALLLNVDGPLVCKGVAEGKKNCP